MSISLKRLKELCDKYDEKNGTYPESGYEGEAVLSFIEENLNDEELESE